MANRITFQFEDDLDYQIFVNWMRCLDNAADWGPNLAKIW